MKIEKLVRATDPDVKWIKERIEEAGTKIGSVHFRKRKDNTLRKMCYRLHVKNPSVAKAPVGIKKSDVKQTSSNSPIYECMQCKKPKGEGKNECMLGPFHIVAKLTSKSSRRPVKSKKEIDKANNQMTVFDVNKVVYEDGVSIGRGAWRTVPLEKVERICSQGTVYEIRYTN